MAKIYLYASQAKLDALMPRGWWRQFSRLNLKVKAPVAEAGVDFSPDPSIYRRLRRLDRKLRKDQKVVGFEIEQDSYSTVISFDGTAALTIESGTVWLAIEGNRTALLLGGSASNVLGQAREAPAARFSPSVATIQAVTEATANSGRGQESLSSGLSYMWQQIRRQGKGAASLRNVRGFAVFVGAYTPVKSQIRRGTATSIDRLVVASPIYVQQT